MPREKPWGKFNIGFEVCRSMLPAGDSQIHILLDISKANENIIDQS